MNLWRHRSWSTLAQVMACCLMAPSHNLNQCWPILNDIHRFSPEGNFTQDTLSINIKWGWILSWISFKSTKCQAKAVLPQPWKLNAYCDTLPVAFRKTVPCTSLIYIIKPLNKTETAGDTWTNICLSHLSQCHQWIVSALVQIMACRHYLNQCCQLDA